MSCYVTESFLTSSLQKCLCNKKYYSKDAVVSLIENDFITNGVKDVLCECLIKFNDIDVLRTLKPHQNIISERMMVHVIKDVIKYVNMLPFLAIMSNTFFLVNVCFFVWEIIANSFKGKLWVTSVNIEKI